MRPLALNAVVRNEAARLPGLLDHAAGFCDEIVVVDQSSDDGTADIARDFGAMVLTDKCYGWAEPSRPIAHEHTRAPWIIALDADEILANPQDVVDLPDKWLSGSLSRVTYIDGRLDHPGPDHQLRYFRRGTVHFGYELHHRIVSLPEHRDQRFVSGDEPWIIHTKSQAEHDEDHARYAQILAGV